MPNTKYTVKITKVVEISPILVTLAIDKSTWLFVVMGLNRWTMVGSFVTTNFVLKFLSLAST